MRLSRGGWGVVAEVAATRLPQSAPPVVIPEARSAVRDPGAGALRVALGPGSTLRYGRDDNLMEH